MPNSDWEEGIQQGKSGCSAGVARCVRDAEAGGSNPLTPTIYLHKQSTQIPNLVSPIDLRSSPKVSAQCNGELINNESQSPITYTRV